MRHNVFQSLGGRRTGRIADAVEVDAVGDASGYLEEGVHEILERVLLIVRHFEGCQLVLLSILAVHTTKGQGDVSATAGRRLLPLLHSVRDLVELSHQRLETLRKFCLRPEFGVHSGHRGLQPSQIFVYTVQALQKNTLP